MRAPRFFLGRNRADLRAPADGLYALVIGIASGTLGKAHAAVFFAEHVA